MPLVALVAGAVRLVGVAVQNQVGRMTSRPKRFIFMSIGHGATQVPPFRDQLANQR